MIVTLSSTLFDELGFRRGSCDNMQHTYVSRSSITGRVYKLKALSCRMGSLNCASALTKTKLAKIHEKAIVKQRKVPNLAKKESWQKNRGIDAAILVIMPFITLMPMSPNADSTRSLVVLTSAAS